MICCRVNRRDSSSGFGFELTFRLKKQVGETSPPSWPAELLQSLARYVFQTGKDIKLSYKLKHINYTVGLEVSRVKVSLGLGKVKSVLTHLAGAYLGLHVAWSDHKFYYSSLNRMLVHYKVTSPHSHSISSGILENLLIVIYTHGWREALPKNTTHWLIKVSNGDLSTWSPVHWPLGNCAFYCL